MTNRSEDENGKDERRTENETKVRSERKQAPETRQTTLEEFGFEFNLPKQRELGTQITGTNPRIRTNISAKVSAKVI